MKKQYIAYYNYLDNNRNRSYGTFYMNEADSFQNAHGIFETWFVKSNVGILLDYKVVSTHSSFISSSIKDSRAYNELIEYYGVNGSLLEPTDFGLEILDKLESSIQSKYAYCLIPLWFAYKKEHIIINYPTNTLYYLMEYIRISSAYRCIKLTDSWSLNDIKSQIGDINPEVRKMLIADKVYMYGHFKDNHIKHKRAIYIQKYFDNWFAILNYNREYIVKHLDGNKLNDAFNNLELTKESIRKQKNAYFK